MNRDLTIIGATGSLSTRVSRLLMVAGCRLKVVARDPDKARRLLGSQPEVVQGDVADPASLHEALRGSRAVYIHLNTETLDPNVSFYTEREGVRNIVAAAEANDVQHLIQIAGMESHRADFFHSGIIATEQIRREGMKAVRESAIPHTFLCCSFFLDSLPRFVVDSSFAVFGPTDGNIHFTNTEQLAEHLRHVVGNSRAFNESLPIQGRRGLSMAAAAAEFFRAYDPRVTVQHLPMSALAELGLPEEDAAFLAHVWEVSSGFVEEFIADDAHHHFGSSSLEISEFASKLRAEMHEGPSA